MSVFRQPETFEDLVGIFFDIRSTIIMTPAAPGYSSQQMGGHLRPAWQMWEWEAVRIANGMAISRDRESMGQIVLLPDTVAMMDTSRFSPLSYSIPRSTRS